MAEADTESSNFHVVMFPWLTNGHLIPFLCLSNKLAQRGCTISLLLPKKSFQQIEYLNCHPDSITLHPLIIPHVEGLPIGAQTLADIPISLAPLLSIAFDRTRTQVEELINETKPKFVIYDLAHWIPEITRPLGIKVINYSLVCASAVALVFVPARNISKDKSIMEKELSEPPNGYPSSTVLLRGHEIRSLLFIGEPFGENITFYERLYMAMKGSDALALRTCSEIESKFCNYMADQYGKPVFLTGPVLLEDSRGNLDENWSYWLSGFEEESVIFCGFTTQVILEIDQFQELILGLELTGLPFLVVAEPPVGASMVEEAIPEGFRERVRGRGMVWGGWIDKKLLIDHPSVGCFINHCGFGTMWESLMSSCQLVMVPELGDQIMNTRLMVEELKVGVEVLRDESGWFSKEHLCNVVMSVMDKDSEIGSIVKQNHAKWRQILGTQGFMDNYIDNFVQNLKGMYDK